MIDVGKLAAYLVESVARELEVVRPGPDQQRRVITELAQKAYEGTKVQLPEDLRIQVITQVVNELAGYGPLQPLLEDPGISEIMVKGPDQVYIERNGELFDVPVVFQDVNHLYRIIDRIVSPLGRRVDADNPTVDARLPDGSRVNIVLPPVSIDGPCITIRKFLINKLTMEQLIAMGSLTANMAEFLHACVVTRLNILITGNTSSGKTTLLNVLTGFIPGNERIVTIEDAVELQLKQKYIVRLETKSPNSDGSGEVTPRDLVRNSLRMRPDRIIIGEVRGGEALDMLQAMNTGHTGSITTLHANSPRESIYRLETLAMMAGLDLPVLAIRRQIASALNLIVHMARLQDGSRRVTQITELSGMEGDVVTQQDIFKFEQTGISFDGKIIGDLRATGIRPFFTPKLEAAGFKLRGEIFGASALKEEGKNAPGWMRSKI
jgi:pilus assembly protein CpaF